MKELSIEEKAKAYDEAIGKAKKINNEHKAQPFDVMLKVFPELKESEDEQHRKWILEYLYDGLRKSDEQFKDHFRAAIAWLEKQSEKPFDYENANIQQKDFAPKVEPKFKVGDWVVFNNKHQSIYQVEKIEYWYYILRHTHGGTFRVCVLHDESLRLFDITKDAKAGDVLASELCDSIILFRGIKNDNIDFYCDYDFSKIDVPGDRFTFNNGQHYGNVEDSKDFHPATKEQRDTLMKAMVDAGYTFDFEKKELKKIEQNTAWSEEDERIYQSIMDDSVQENQLNDKQTNWLRDIKYRYFPQPKHAWSEEDEIGFRDAMWAIEQARTIAKDENDMGNLWYAERWLKSLKNKVQPKQEWDEKDKYMLNNVIDTLKPLSQTTHSGYAINSMIAWLKSLRPQNTWKPSEEQMNTLLSEVTAWTKGCHQQIVLESIYNDLKKLMEE